MAWSFTEWTPDDEPGEVIDVTVAGAWDQILQNYTGGQGNRPLARIIEIAQSHGVVAVVLERRYIDADWRSEHARFYGGTFARYPSVCHRLHFFTCPVDSDLKSLSGVQDHYRGYAVMRPLPDSPVGRTMIAPPPELSDAVRCEVVDRVDLFGWALTISAMPFISQDTQFLRCAHAAMWMVTRFGALRYGLGTRLPAEVHDAATGGVAVGRQLPSDGLSVYQMLTGLEALGLSPSLKSLTGPDAKDHQKLLSLYGIACRYVNSGLPPIIISDTHAWVLVAWSRVGSAAHPWLTLWRHDDARGPYLPVDDPWHEPEADHSPWTTAVLPLLPKMYIEAERAEELGRYWLREIASASLGTSTRLAVAIAAGDVAFRTFAVPSNEFKQRSTGRLPDELAAMYRLAFMSHYVWVVEAVDRAARTAGDPDVMGEVVLDATTSQYLSLTNPQTVIAAHADDIAFKTGADHRAARVLNLPTTPGLYLSDLFTR